MLDMSGRIYQMSGRGLLLNLIKCPAELKSFWQSLKNGGGKANLKPWYLSESTDRQTNCDSNAALSQLC